MKPDWDKLAAAMEDSTTTIVGDVDCTVHQGVCSENGVSGYPTIKYTDDSGEWQDYQGGRDYASLEKHAKSLTPPCNYYDNKEKCTEEAIAFLDEWAAKSAADRKAEVADREEKIKTLKETFEAVLKGLNEKYEDAQKKQKADEITKAEMEEVVGGLRKEFQEAKDTQDDGVKELKPKLGLLKQLKDKGEGGEL